MGQPSDIATDEIAYDDVRKLRGIAKDLQAKVSELYALADHVVEQNPKRVLREVDNQAVYCLQGMINDHPFWYNASSNTCSQEGRDGFVFVRSWETFISLLAHKLIVGEVDEWDRRVVYTVSGEGRRVVAEHAKAYAAKADAVIEASLAKQREAAQREEANREAAKQEGMREEDAEAEA